MTTGYTKWSFYVHSKLLYNISNGTKLCLHFSFHGRQKYTQIGIFGMKIKPSDKTTLLITCGTSYVNKSPKMLPNPFFAKIST
jgi:hypothetical protein